MNTRHIIAAAIMGLGMGAAGVAAASTLSILQTRDIDQEHTGDPGGSTFPYTTSVPGPGPGVPWQSRNGGGAITGGWPTGPGMSLDPTFPSNWGTSGWHGAYLNLDAPAPVTFQYMGKGDSSLANSFEVLIGGVWTMLFDQTNIPCLASGAAPVTPSCVSGSNEFTYNFGAGLIPFRFITGAGATLTNDGTSNPTDLSASPGFFLGVDPYLASASHQLGGQAVYAGLSDLPSPGDHDFQDLGVRISTVPEPGTLGLIGLSLAAAAGSWRRRRKQDGSQ